MMAEGMRRKLPRCPRAGNVDEPRGAARAARTAPAKSAPESRAAKSRLLQRELKPNDALLRLRLLTRLLQLRMNCDPTRCRSVA